MARSLGVRATINPPAGEVRRMRKRFQRKLDAEKKRKAPPVPGARKQIMEKKSLPRAPFTRSKMG